MAIALGAAGTRFVQSVAGTSWAVPYPASVAANDLLVLHFSTSGGAVTTPSGWTEIYRETAISNPKGGLWIKVAAGTETGDLTVTTSSTTGNAMMWRYTGVDPVTPQDATATSVANTVATLSSVLPSITTVTANTMLIYANSGNSSSVTMSSTTGTERVDHGALGGTGAKSGALYDEPVAATGATGTRTIDLSASRSNWGAMMALRPASTGSPITATATGIATGEAFGTPTNLGSLTSTATGISTGEAFGTPTSLGSLTSTATGISSGEAFGTPTHTGFLTTNAVGIASGEAFGTPSQVGMLTSTATGISSGEVFGTPVFTAGAITSTATGISSVEAFGTSSNVGHLTSTATGIGSGEVFGTSSILTNTIATAVGIPSGEAFGTPAHNPSGLFTLPVSKELLSLMDIRRDYYAASVGIPTEGKSNDDLYDKFLKDKTGLALLSQISLESEYYKALVALPNTSTNDRKRALFKQWVEELYYIRSFFH